MSAAEPREPLAQAYIEACLLELRALKPGNVGHHAPGHDMQAADFEASAEASAAPMAMPGLGLGERIFRAVEATRRRVGCNTNLGIVLVCAPLAQAALQGVDGGLDDAVRQVIHKAGIDDTRQVFAAIRLASPGGLGRVARHDVSGEAQAGLLDAMRHAPPHDRIAEWYVDGFRPVFDDCLPVLTDYVRRWKDMSWAAAGLFMHMLAMWPDSHIVRKHGAEQAEAVRQDAQKLWSELSRMDQPKDMVSRLMDFDGKLKASGFNPGTTADLTVGSLFAARLMGLSGPRFLRES